MAAAIAAVVTVVMLSAFFLQYRWLADEITSTSAAEHNAFLAESFERRARSDMHRLADDILEAGPTADRDTLLRLLNQAISDDESLVGVVFRGADGLVLGEGELPTTTMAGGALWLDDYLLLSYGVGTDAVKLGSLEGAFKLEELRVESALFEARIAEEEARSRRESIALIAGVALLLLTLCSILVWLIARNTSRRIQQLKEQAEKLRDADFGERLPEVGGDDLGDLAAVFNQMRDRLRETTISKNYVDSIFSSMNDAIVVTSADGVIKRINKATTHMLGYEEGELEGTSIDFIVDTGKSKSLTAATPSGTPRDAFFESKYGESIPVSYTCSELDGTEAEPGDRIYAAQNTTERLRAEKRIRYLARIDALTKIPNRMQFQHLLQRAIARARRDQRSLCLFYVDIDHFKEINDTFGHLAGDTTLETVAERLGSVVPEKTIIGRLAGDEFAVILNGPAPDKHGREETNRLAT